MIAGHNRHIMRIAKQFQPLPGHIDLDVERQVDEVAGHRDMVRARRLDVAHDGVDDAVVQELPAVAVPVDIAGDPLGDEIAIGYIGKRPQMNVGKMRKPEHSSLLRHAVSACQRPMAA